MIRKDDILKMTEKGISVFRYYLPVDFKVGKNFRERGLFGGLL